tara:strand:- start:144658 stop:145098 length:441 start_codon:yes stop_codon:yes gene_type:complete
MPLKTLTIIHAALVLGLIVLGSVSYFFGVGFISQFDLNGDIFIYLVPTFAVLGYFGSIFIFRKQLLQIHSSEELSIKLAKYQAASIVKYALIEGPAVLAFIMFMNSGYTLYFTIAVCLVIYLAIQKPNKDKLIQELHLNATEQQQL